MDRRVLWLLPVIVIGGAVRADDWPVFGRDHTRNAVSPEKGAPTAWRFQDTPKTLDRGKVIERHADTKNVRWRAQLGSQSLGGPVVSGGLVWVGTNNQHPRDPNDFRTRRDGKKEPIDKSVLMCFRESDGQFLWQLARSRLGPGIEGYDWASLGCAPAVEGDWLWLITNRCEAVCFDIGPLRRGTGEPRERWTVDMRQQFGVVRNAPIMAAGLTASVPAPYRDRLYVATGNGTDRGWPPTVPAPQAPSLVCLDKHTGKTLWTDNSPGKDIMGYQFSTPLVVEINGRGQVIHGQGDGWLRAFDALTGRLIWKCDLNAKSAKWDPFRGTKCNIVASPVYADGRIYAALGQDPASYEGLGQLYCIDPTKEGDVSPELDDGPGKGKPNPNSAVVWRYGDPEKEPQKAGREYTFGRMNGNCTVHDGLVYAADLPGYVYCLDARTGQHYWTHDVQAGTWGTSLWVDGKVYVATEDGDVWIFAHGKEKRLLHKVEVDGGIRSSPVFANGVLYLMTEQTLFAVREEK